MRREHKQTPSDEATNLQKQTPRRFRPGVDRDNTHRRQQSKVQSLVPDRQKGRDRGWTNNNPIDNDQNASLPPEAPQRQRPKRPHKLPTRSEQPHPPQRYAGSNQHPQISLHAVTLSRSISLRVSATTPRLSRPTLAREQTANKTPPPALLLCTRGANTRPLIMSIADRVPLPRSCKPCRLRRQLLCEV